MTKKILISLDDEAEKALNALTDKAHSTMSRVVRDLIFEKYQSANTAAEDNRFILASVRKTERDVQIALGVLNSIALGFQTISDAPYQDPDDHKHDILRGAERAENAKIRKRIQSGNFKKNREDVNE